MIVFNHYVLFYLKWMDILNIFEDGGKNMSFVTND